MYSSYLFFFKQKTAYEMRISDWSSDVCSSDLVGILDAELGHVVERGLRVRHGQPVLPCASVEVDDVIDVEIEHRDPRDAGVQVDRLVQPDPAVAAAKPGPAPVVPPDFTTATDLLVALHPRTHPPTRPHGH